MTSEAEKLDKLAKQVTIYLVLAVLVSFIVGFVLLDQSGRLLQFLSVAFIGFSGSAVAALTSCLDRYANGFELDDGTKEPLEAEGETFNQRMSRWFYVRPILGFVVAPVFIWGVNFFVENPEQYRSSAASLGFTAFMGGLLAKSVLDLIKNLFKNVFRA